MKNIEKYAFDAPLIITDSGFIKLAPEGWEDTATWVSHLDDHWNKSGPIKGIIIPFELELHKPPKGTSGYKKIALQDCHGVELLTWLRWSAFVHRMEKREKDGMVYHKLKASHLQELPVLAVAFQPLEVILQRSLNLLLVLKGTQFARLPEALSVLPNFVSSVRKKNQEMKFDIESLDQIAGVREKNTQAITHHALANDFYGAFRLWEGYKAALAGAMESGELRKSEKKLIEAESDRVTKSVFSWEKNGGDSWECTIQKKLSQPHVSQYLTFVKQGLGAPRYPVMENADRVILKHVENGFENGVLENTRILLVDDEFNKGQAEVLLQILFKKSKFTYIKGNSEWVYSEGEGDEEWDRFVCVNSADAALHWLALWGEVDKDEEDYKNFALNVTQSVWLGEWRQRQTSDLYTRLADIARNHKYHKPKRRKNSLVLLDLRLEPEEQEEMYDPLKLKSVLLRSLIKANRDPAPVIMLTASRQAMNYVMVMEDAIKADGWLMKEGPDIPPDAGNSACAVHYLLQRIHRFAAKREWYRDEMKWLPEWIDDYEKFRSNVNWKSRLTEIHQAATICFKAIQKPHEDPNFEFTYLAVWIDSKTGLQDSYEKILVHRLVIFGMHLLTRMDGNMRRKKKLAVEKFNMQMPGSQLPNKTGVLRAAGVKHISNVLNFHNICHCNNQALDKGALLEEEYKWFLQQFPVETFPHICQDLTAIMEKRKKWFSEVQAPQ